MEAKLCLLNALRVEEYRAKLDEIRDGVNLPHGPFTHYPLCILFINMHAYYCAIARNTILYYKIYIVQGYGLVHYILLFIPVMLSSMD